MSIGKTQRNLQPRNPSTEPAEPKRRSARPLRARPLPRRSQDRFEPPKAEAPKRQSLLKRFGRQFKKPGDGTWAATAGISATVPAAIVGVTAGGAHGPSLQPQAEGAERTAHDDRTPVAMAREVLDPTRRNHAPAAREFPPRGTFAAKTWDKIDRNRNGSINKDEIKKYLSRIGVEAGFLGLVHNQAASEAMKMVDKNQDGKISKAEVKSLVKIELKDDEFNADGQLKPEVIDQAFAKMDTNRSGAVNNAELEAAVKAAMDSNSLFQGTIATIARKIGMDVMDTNHSGAISRAEFEAVAADLAKIRASLLP